MKIPLSKLVIGERQRIDLGDIDSMCESLAKYGQINPIYVKPLPDGNYELIAGMRRTTAAKRLGWTEIAVTESEPSISTLHQQEIELEEDIRRKGRTWQEKCIAMLKLHRIKKINDPAWSLKLTADTVGKSIGHVNEVLNVANILERTKAQAEPWEKELWSVATFPEAVNILIDRNIRDATEELEKRRERIRVGLQLQQQATLPSTDSPSESVPERLPYKLTPVEPTVIEIFDKLQCPQRFALAYVETPEQLTHLLCQDWSKLLTKDGCAVLWFSDLGMFKQMTETFRSAGMLPKQVFPLIWNIINGPQWNEAPFSLSYHAGMFIKMPGYQNPGIDMEGVVTCQQQDNSLPIPVVQHCLDAFGAVAGDKILLPIGGSEIAVAQCGMSPVFPTNEETRMALTLHYQSTINNVKVI